MASSLCLRASIWRSIQVSHGFSRTPYCQERICSRLLASRSLLGARINFSGFMVTLERLRKYRLPSPAQSSTVILEVSMHVLLKYSSASLACSSVFRPTKPNRRNLPSFVYFSWTSVTTPFWLNNSLSLVSDT